MDHLKMERLGLNILKGILVFSLVFTACKQEKEGYIEYVERNNSSKMYQSALSEDSCFTKDFFSGIKFKVRYFLINNKEICPGVRSVSSYTNFDIFIEQSDSINMKDYINNFENHVKSLDEKDIHNMDVNIFTDMPRHEVKRITSLTNDLTIAFYQIKCKSKFIPFNVFFVYNANEIIESLKVIPPISD